MLNLLNSKSLKFPLDIRSNKFEKGETILHAAVNQGNMNTSRAILDYPIIENEDNNYQLNAPSSRQIGKK